MDLHLQEVFSIINSNPDKGEVVLMNQALCEKARKNDKRPAYVSVWCPDEWVVNLGGHKSLVDCYIAIRVPVELIQEFMKKKREASQVKAETAQDVPNTEAGQVTSPISQES